MLSRIINAVIVGLVVFIALVLIGLLLIEVGLEDVGGFLRSVAGLVGVLAALYHFFVSSDGRPLLR